MKAILVALALLAFPAAQSDGSCAACDVCRRRYCKGEDPGRMEQIACVRRNARRDVDCSACVRCMESDPAREVCR